MSQLRLHHSSTFRISAERRLAYEVGDAETQKKEGAQTSTTNETMIKEFSKIVTEDRLNELSGSLKAKFNNDQEKIENALKTMEQVAPSEAADKKIIEYNILRLRERIGSERQTEEQKQILKKSIAEKKVAAEERAITNAKPLTLQDGAKGILNQLNKGAISVTDNLLPASWTKEWTPTGKMTAGYVMGAGIGVVTIVVARKIWSWLRGASAEGKEAAAHAKGSSMRKWLVYTAVAGLAALGIYKVLDPLLGLQKQLSDAMAKMTSLTGEARTEAEKKIQELQNAIEKQKEKLPEKERAKELTKTAAKEVGKTTERFGLGLTGRAMLMMNRKNGIQAGIMEAKDENAISVLLNNPEIQNKTIGDIRTITSTEKAASFLPPTASDSEKKALYFLALCMKDMEPRIRENLPAGTKMETVSLKTCLDQIHRVPKIFEKLQVSLKGKNWKDVAEAPALLMGAFATTDLDDVQNDPVMAAEWEKLGLKGKEAAFCAECMANGSSELLKNVTVSGEKKEIHDALLRIRETLYNPETTAYLTQYLQGKSTKDFPYEQEFLNHLKGDLTVKDAVQLYMYMRLATKHGTTMKLSDAHSVGALMTQMKVLSLLGKEKSDLGQRLQADLLSDLTRMDGLLTLPDGTRAILQNFSAQAGSIALDFGQDWLQKLLKQAGNQIPEWYKDYSTVINSGAAAAATVGTPYALTKFYHMWKVGAMGRLSDALHLTNYRTVRNIQHYFTRSGASAYDISDARDLAKDVGSVKNVVHNIHNPAVEKAYVNLFNRKFTDASFKEFYREMADLKARGIATTEIDDIVKMVQDTIEPHRVTLEIRRSAFVYERAARALGMAAQGYVIYEDAKGVLEAWDQEAKMREHGAAVMEDIELQLTKSAGFKRHPAKPNCYVHAESGIEVDLKNIQKQIEEGDAGLESKTFAQYARTGTSIASLGATILMGAKAFTGPAGIGVAAVEITVRAGISTWEEGKLRSFIKGAPPWLLATLGTMQTTGIAEEDWLNKANTWMMSDILHGGNDKEEIRKKMLFTIFCHDLEVFAPELFEDITQGINAPPLMDQLLYNKDFQAFILPAFYLRLYAESNNANVEWTQIQSGVIPSDITMVEIRAAMRDSAVLYAQHLREKRYIDALSMPQNGSADPALQDPMIQGFIATMGQEVVFGSPLSTLTSAMIAANKGKTRAQLVLEQLNTNVNFCVQDRNIPVEKRFPRKGIKNDKTRALSNINEDTKAQKLEFNSNLFAVTPGNIAGLDTAINFGDTEEILDLIEDPVTRERLRKIFAKTTKEKEGAVYNIQTQKDLPWQTWLSPYLDASRENIVHETRNVANYLRKERKQPELVENVSADAAQHSITEDGIALFETFGEFASRDQSLEQTLYTEKHTPVVFSSLEGVYGDDVKNQRELCKMLSIPNTSQKEFGEENILAVLFEGKRLSNGAQVVLATYVFRGDDKTPYRFVQETAIRNATANGIIVVKGMAKAMNSAEFAKQAHSAELLKMIKKGIADQEKEAGLDKETQEKEAAQAMTEWVKQKPERDALEAANTQARAKALEIAKLPGSMIYVPGEYVRNEEKQEFYQKQGDFQGTINGQLVQMNLPPSVGSPGMSAKEEPKATVSPRVYEKFNFSGAYDYTNITLDTLKGNTETLDKDDLLLARMAIVKPFDLTGHPREHDEEFVTKVHKAELHRILDIATYEQSSNWGGWTAAQFKAETFNKLWPYYEKSPHKELYLNTLLNNLLDEGNISTGAYARILSNMQKTY